MKVKQKEEVISLINLFIFYCLCLGVKNLNILIKLFL